MRKNDNSTECTDSRILCRPNLVIFDLTRRCNNACSFCMVLESEEPRDDLSLKDIEAVLERETRGIRVDLFGGEPTLHPSFWEIVEAVSRRGYSLSLASNARWFSRSGRAERLSKLTGRTAFVRTSLYGVTEQDFEEVTRVKGSYAQFVAGVKKLVAAGLRVDVNVVLTTLTLGKMGQIADLLTEWKVNGVKLSGLVRAEGCVRLEPRLSNVRRALTEWVPKLRRSGLTITLEKLPVCAAEVDFSCYSAERDLIGWERVFADDRVCSMCLMRGVCDGLDPGYAARNGYDDLVPYRSLNVRALQPFPEPHENLKPEPMRIHIYRIPDDWSASPEICGRCKEIFQAVTGRLGRVAFVTDSQVSGP